MTSLMGLPEIAAFNKWLSVWWHLNPSTVCSLACQLFCWPMSDCQIHVDASPILVSLYPHMLFRQLNQAQEVWAISVEELLWSDVAKVGNVSHSEGTSIFITYTQPLDNMHTEVSCFWMSACTLGCRLPAELMEVGVIQAVDLDAKICLLPHEMDRAILNIT